MHRWGKRETPKPGHVEKQRDYANGAIKGHGASYDAILKRLTTQRDGYGQSPGQLAALPPGDIRAVLSSPPYAEVAINRQREEEPNWATESQYLQGKTQGQHSAHGYGTTPGNLGTLPVGAHAGREQPTIWAIPRKHR